MCLVWIAFSKDQFHGRFFLFFRRFLLTYLVSSQRFSRFSRIFWSERYDTLNLHKILKAIEPIEFLLLCNTKIIYLGRKALVTSEKGKKWKPHKLTVVKQILYEHLFFQPWFMVKRHLLQIVQTFSFLFGLIKLRDVYFRQNLLPSVVKTCRYRKFFSTCKFVSFFLLRKIFNIKFATFNPEDESDT